MVRTVLRAVAAVALAGTTLLGATLLGTVSGAPGAGAAPALTVESTDTAGFPRVALTVSADVDLAAAGTTVTVSQDGAPGIDVVVAPVASGASELMIVFDVSGSMQGARIASSKAATQEFLGLLPPETAVGLVAFGQRAVLVTPPTRDRGAVAAAVDSLQAGGQTALYDGVALANAAFTPGNARREIVVLSDGGDTASVTSLEQAVASLTPGTRLDVIELRSTESNPAALAALVGTTGGVVRSVDDPEAVPALYQAIGQGLVRGYRVSYLAPSSAAGTVVVAATGAFGTATASTEVPAVDTGTDVAPVRPDGSGGGGGGRSAVDRSAGSARIVVGAVALFVGLVIAIAILAWPPISKRRVRRRLGIARTGPDAAALTEGIDSALERTGKRDALAALLDAAGNDRSPGEFVMLTGAILFVVAAVLAFIGGALGFLIGIVAGPLIVLATLRRRAKRRRRRFDDQLPDLLQVIANMLRSGYGLAQALEVATEQADDPAGPWIGQAVLDMRTDRPAGQALRAVAERAQSDDFEWVATAVDINREIGGDLSEILDSLADTVRERAFLRGQARTLSAEGRMSAYVVLCLPPGVMAISALTNRNYASELTTPTGMVLLGIAGVLMVIGYVWIQALVKKVGQ